MYHTRFKGTHYEAGVHYGTLLHKNRINPLKHIPITDARRDFTAKCVPLYKNYFPGILEEIEGITDALETKCDEMLAFLLSMYCFTFDVRCTSIAMTDGEHTVFARNSDFALFVEKICDSTYYRIDRKYAFIGNTTAWSEIEDGVNEKGLAVGLNFLYPTVVQPGLNAGMLVRYILENCATTDEALEVVKSFPNASMHSLTFADKGGDIAVAECNCKEIHIRRGGEYQYAINHYLTEKMLKYQYQGVDDCRSHEREKILVDAFAGERSTDTEFARRLLSGGLCAYDRGLGMDTVWSAIYDLTNGDSFICDGNPSRKKFKEDMRLKRIAK